MRFAPRPDQVEAVSSIVAQLETAERTQAIMACGTGKTFVSQKAAEQITLANPDSLILVAMPNPVLVEQMIGEWSRQASPGHEFATLAVNSRRAGRSSAEEDEITDVRLAGVTPAPAMIAAVMLAPGRKVVFSTYQSMAHISTALGLPDDSRPGFEIDVLVMAEAHRTAGVTRADSPSAFKLAFVHDGNTPHFQNAADRIRYGLRFHGQSGNLRTTGHHLEPVLGRRRGPAGAVPDLRDRSR